MLLNYNANFSNCTHKEIQIPSAWSDGSITIKVNQGSFVTGQDLYLFVVDTNGIHSSGYLVKIGGGGNNLKPTPPSGLKVIN